MKIHWAPTDVPPKRRMQMLAVVAYAVFFCISYPMLFAFFGVLLFYANIYLKVLTAIYLAYIYLDHSTTSSVRNGNGWKFWRSNFLWRNFRAYFPIELIKTAELPPNRNYLVASFPHGIIGIGISCNMGTDIDKWCELFPGVRPKLATLDMHFYMPIFRDLIRGWGLVSVSKKSLLYYLSRSNDPKHKDNKDGFTSNAVAVVVGGAQEALDSQPGQYILTIKNRKGFVKLAIKTGSPIVPSFSFGEVDVFRQLENPPDSWLRKFQSFIKKITGVSPIVVLGRGIFQYNFGLLPRRRHIVQVVGAPIEVEKCDKPKPEYVDEIHEKVIKALVDMFETYKDKYIPKSKDVKLVIH